MELSQKHKDVLEGRICPKCASGTKLIHNDNAIGSNFIVACRNYPTCDYYTISEPNSTKPVGRLAGPVLRYERQLAYELFNKFCKSSSTTKELVMTDLLEHLKVPVEYNRITYFNVENCRRTQSWCIRQNLEANYQRTKEYINMAARREIDGKQKFKRCIIIKQITERETLVEFDDEVRKIVTQVRVKKR